MNSIWMASEYEIGMAHYLLTAQEHECCKCMTKSFCHLVRQAVGGPVNETREYLRIPRIGQTVL